MPLRESPTPTAAQLAANRSNARHSTGPRTPEGKSRSRLSALQHGRWASSMCWSEESLRALGEDPEEFERLREDLRLAEGPAHDPLWELQIEDLARLYWRRRRLERAWEVQALRNDRDADLTPVAPAGALLLKQLDAVDRAIDRKTRLLLRMREAKERQERRLEAEKRRREREAARARQPRRGKPGVLDRLARGESLNWAELAQAGVELEEMSAQTERLEEETRQEQAHLAALQENNDIAERSRNVDENKGPSLRTVTGDK